MNRYTAQGIARDAESGLTVLVVFDKAAELVEAFDQLNDRTYWAKVVRTLGKQELRHSSGGRVLLRNVNQGGGRGVRADVVIAEFHPTEQQVDELIPALVAAAQPRELVTL